MVPREFEQAVFDLEQVRIVVRAPLGEDLGDFPISVYTADSPIPAVCRDAQGGDVDVKVMAHDPAASATRTDRPNGVAIRTYMTAVFENFAGLSWYKMGDGRMWLISARRYFDCLQQLKDRGITIYATADEVSSFPPPQAVLSPPQEISPRKTRTC